MKDVEKIKFTWGFVSIAYHGDSDYKRQKQLPELDQKKRMKANGKI